MTIGVIGQYIAGLLMLVPASGFAAGAPQHVSITDVDARDRGKLVRFAQGEMHILPDAFPSATELELQKQPLGDYNLPKGLRTNQRAYKYTFSQKPTGRIVLLMNYVPHGKDNARKLILFKKKGSDKWTRLRTLAHKSEGYVQADLPEQSGTVIFAWNSQRKESPLRSVNYTDFGQVPHTDTAAVMDAKSGAFLFKQNAKKQRPIASLSKLVTSLVFLESDPDLNRVIAYNSANNREGAVVSLNNGEQLTLSQVLMGALMPSANNMAETLSRSTPMSRDAFITQMNTRMNELKMYRTHFVEPTGLDQRNVSTAGNIARLARYAFAKYPNEFYAAASKSEYRFQLANSGRSVSLYSTNKFDGRGKYEAVAFKTGYYPGYAERTLVMKIREIATGHEVIVVLLGNTQYGTVFDQAYSLADWSFHNWDFHNY